MHYTEKRTYIFSTASGPIAYVRSFDGGARIFIVGSHLLVHHMQDLDQKAYASVDRAVFRVRQRLNKLTGNI